MIIRTRGATAAVILAATLALAKTTEVSAKNGTRRRLNHHQASTYGFKQTSDEDQTHDTSIVFDDEDGGIKATFVIDDDDPHHDDPAEGNACGDSCVDNADFVSMMGLPCHAHTYFECEMFVQVGFTEQEVVELIANCPCSCQACPTAEPTRTPSLSPTKTPSTSPTTSHPSASPVSSSPTSRPTSAPVSPGPTYQPSASPISSNPTSRPSAAPVSPSPTASPTFLPSSTPTLPPTTYRPMSSAPTSSPVQTSMSTTTRIKPIDTSAGEVSCPPGFSGLMASFGCKGAIQCADGVKLFGPIPCRSSPTGDLVFDVAREKCVEPTDDFVCHQMPAKDEVVPSDLETETNPDQADSGATEESRVDASPTLVHQTDSPISIPSPSPTDAKGAGKTSEAPTSNDAPQIQETTPQTAGSDTIGKERIDLPQTTEEADEEDGGFFGSLSLKELIIISVGGGCLVLFIGLSVFYAARRRKNKKAKKAIVVSGEKRHNAGKSSSSTIGTDDATPVLEYYTYINKAMKSNRAVTNFSTGKQDWSTRREFLDEKRSRNSEGTEATCDEESGKLTIDPDATVLSEDEGATEVAYNDSHENE